MLSNRWMALDPWKAMDQMFNEVLAAPARRRVGPRLRVREDGDGYELRAPLPGVGEGAIDVDVGEDFITLKARRTVEAPPGYEPRRRERTDLGFERTYRLPDRIDAAKVEARLENGVLAVKLPKRADAKVRTIVVAAPQAAGGSA